MQHLILALTFLFTTGVMAQSTEKEQLKETGNIKVSVVNALSDNGTIAFALYNEEGFLKTPLESKSAIIENGLSIVEFENISTGNYSIVCFHDENSNGQMDFELNGMPKEAFGVSNNVMNFGPPQFEDAKFEVSNNNVILEIKF
ncbi:Uncharacterized conserved protein, DUF2141 family [Lutibacter agarilyticus]|uniref:Uncharacterized conserved protein, DUF2141 family n=1 Tax=Lutibacter agarilyticus TaxID=1109740 RepID=A0A238WUU2_9FLAO|nr:DUF2141 domain-containing protein [Lutibacter agarilyticus]SNR50292.1 Uncharacterized conserved protein, DUF2141 family [Lutibacter agarilyticus]